jgi:hypothetical protein
VSNYRDKAFEIARKIIRREPDAQDDIEAVHLLEVELEMMYDKGRGEEKEKRMAEGQEAGLTAQDYAEKVLRGHAGNSWRQNVENVTQAILEAEERGRQEAVVLRSQSQHGFLSSRTDTEAGIEIGTCVCGLWFTCDMFEVNEALNDHVRQAWIEQHIQSEYSEVEQDCKGCMGPCGHCEEPEDEGKGVIGYAEGQIVS